MIGSTITHYHIIEKLGEGGMGVVYKAEDLKLRRPVALKILRAQSQQLRARLLVEAEAAASLNHPNICTVHEIDDEHLFLTMEFLDGQTVAEKIRQQPLPLEEAIDIAVQSAQGLQAAHEKGITHRDVKSSNIMITRSGQVKVMDFGLALTDELTRITQPGVVVGTPAYMSPEQAAGNPIDRRTDIWAMGIVLYEMISGRLPFRGETQAAVVHSILHDQPQPLTAVRSDLPVELDRIVKKALAKGPSERYQHIDEMLVDLKILRNSFGEQQRSNQSLALPPPKSKHRRYLYAGAAALVVVLMLSIWHGKPLGFFRELAPQTSRATIAVLPLANLSAAAGQEYFSDGMTDALITELGTINSLRVISRTSVMRYKGSRESLSKIAAQLNVNHVLEGTVLQDGDRVRVSARLIRAGRDEEQVWTRTYERDLKSVLALQREVAQAVASEIGVRFRAESAATAATVDPKAYRAYLLGLQYSNDVPNRSRAMDQFERAIKLDSNFAPAYAALARSYAIGGAGRSNSRQEIRRQALEFADKALHLDKSSAEAHNVLGWVKTYFDYDWSGAARAYQRALELNPSSSEGQHSYSHYLMIMSKVEEGLAAGRRASELSPFDRVIAGHQVWGLYIARRYNEAVTHSKSILDADPTNFYARDYAYRVYEQLGDYQRIIGEQPDAVNRTDLARAYALSGSEADAQRLLKEMLQRSDGLNAPFGIALVYLALRDKTRALDWLERGYERRVFPLPDISVDARFDPLRSEPRFQELLRRMGLDDRMVRERLRIPLPGTTVR